MRWLFTTLVLCVSGWAGWASADELAYRDGDGNWRWTDSLESPAFVQKGAGTDPTIVGVFSVTYADVVQDTDIGFDNPTSGAARRQTFNAVLAYLSSILDVPGTADLIVVESQTDGGLALAAAGPFLEPRLGFQGGLVFEHLTTGVDPRDDSFDGTVSVDFGFDWNSDQDATSEIEFDLYTALLHEVTHALGFFSAVGEDARSQLLNEDGVGLFSFFDSFLLRGATETPLFLAGGEVNALSDDLVSRDLFFDGPLAADAFGSSPPVFAPETFFDGSSIAHWDPSVGPEAVMLPILVRGDERRRLTVWELQMLADLGYDLAPCVDLVSGADDCELPQPVEPPGEQPPGAGLPGTPGEPGAPEAPGAPDPNTFIPPAADSGGCTVASGRTGVAWILLLSLFAVRRVRRA